MPEKKVAIVVDSTASIPADILKPDSIHTMPLRVNWPEEETLSFRDVVELSAQDFYRRLRESEEIPTTSQPSPGEFVQLFNEVAEDADEIVAVLVSSEISGTMQSAQFALNMVEGANIHLVDSKTTAMALGMIALQCAEMAQAGKSSEDIIHFAQQAAEDSRTWVLVDTLDYLHKGGRVSGSRKMIGNMLSMKPLLHVVDGRIELFGTVRTRKKAINTMLDIIEVEIKTKQRVHIAMMHADALEQAEEVAAIIQERYAPEKLHIADISPVVGTHTGPGALGIAHLALD